jgi:hypothetical protein
MAVMMMPMVVMAAGTYGMPVAGISRRVTLTVRMNAENLKTRMAQYGDWDKSQK